MISNQNIKIHITNDNQCIINSTKDSFDKDNIMDKSNDSLFNLSKNINSESRKQDLDEINDFVNLSNQGGVDKNIGKKVFTNAKMEKTEDLKIISPYNNQQINPKNDFIPNHCTNFSFENCCINNDTNENYNYNLKKVNNYKQNNIISLESNNINYNNDDYISPTFNINIDYNVLEPKIKDSSERGKKNAPDKKSISHNKNGVHISSKKDNKSCITPVKKNKMKNKSNNKLLSYPKESRKIIGTTKIKVLTKEEKEILEIKKKIRKSPVPKITGKHFPIIKIKIDNNNSSEKKMKSINSVGKNNTKKLYSIQDIKLFSKKNTFKNKKETHKINHINNKNDVTQKTDKTNILRKRMNNNNSSKKDKSFQVIKNFSKYQRKNNLQNKENVNNQNFL